MPWTQEQKGECGAKNDPQITSLGNEGAGGDLGSGRRVMIEFLIPNCQADKTISFLSEHLLD